MTDSAQERLAAGIAMLAVRVFGEADAARDWLRTPNPALAGQAPSRLLATGEGATRVRAVLTRMEHGIVE